MSANAELKGEKENKVGDKMNEAIKINEKEAEESTDIIVQKTIQCSKMKTQNCGMAKPIPKTIGFLYKPTPIGTGLQKIKVYTLDVVTLEVVTLEVVPLCN